MPLETEKFQKLFDQALESEIMAVAEELAGRVREKTPVGATGKLGGSFASFTKVATGMVIAEVGSPLNYGEYVEFGTRPHWAPLRPLFAYVDALVSQGRIDITVRGLSSREQATKRRYLPRTFSRAREVYRVAKLIQYKIAHHGTPARHMIRDSLQELGLGYKIIETDVGKSYDIDIATWLAQQKPNILDKVKGQM